jgi:rhodanese-related sulfurtransferase
MTIDELLERARLRLDRVSVGDLAAEIAAGAVVVDIRPVELRQRDGEMPGALVIDRNVLEWRLDQACAWRSVDLQPGQKVIVFCDEGYQSSLAAVTLQELGIEGATDLDGGYQAYRALRDGVTHGVNGSIAGPADGSPS